MKLILKYQKKYRVITLNEKGTSLQDNPAEIFHSENRYRDLVLGSNGRITYVTNDSFDPV